MTTLRHPELDRQNVGYILQTKDGKFKSCVGMVMYIEDDDDSMIVLNTSCAANPSLEAALALFDAHTRERLAYVFEAPVPADKVGFVWQSELEKAEEQRDRISS